MPIEQFAVGRADLRLAGGSTEPVVSAEKLAAAISPDEVETFRPLLPVGYEAVAAAYRAAAASVSVDDLSGHYTAGMDFFHGEFVPEVKAMLRDLSGGEWDFSDFVGYAAGSDVDFMAHAIEAVAPREGVSIFPGDWYGFLVGNTHDACIRWEPNAHGRLAALCVPSVRNGQFTAAMAEFLDGADACLLNINLFPTLPAAERNAVAARLAGVMEKSIVSISFSRGFGLTASQLGVALVHREHPYRARFDRQWAWFTYFYNAIAARAFMAVPLPEVRAIDDARRVWVRNWLDERDLPAIDSGTYYVKTFRIVGDIPAHLSPLHRGEDRVRLCFKPPIF